MNHYRDTGHYYLNGKLVPDMKEAECREKGGIASVTTILEYFSDPGLTFWKIAENVEAAFNVMERAVNVGIDLDGFRKMVADEFYRVHNHLVIGTLVDKAIEQAVIEGVSMGSFGRWWETHADPRIGNIITSCRLAYEWIMEHSEGKVVTQKAVYNEERFIAGTADFHGRFTDKGGVYGNRVVDLKTRFFKKHPGYTGTGKMKALPYKKTSAHKMQLGTYGSELKVEGGWILAVSTNPLIEGIKPVYYEKDELIRGFKSFQVLSRCYQIEKGFI